MNEVLEPVYRSELLEMLQEYAEWKLAQVEMEACDES